MHPCPIIDVLDHQAFCGQQLGIYFLHVYQGRQSCTQGYGDSNEEACADDHYPEDCGQKWVQQLWELDHRVERSNSIH